MFHMNDFLKILFLPMLDIFSKSIQLRVKIENTLDDYRNVESFETKQKIL